MSPDDIYSDIDSASHLSEVTRKSMKTSLRRLFETRPFPSGIVKRVVPSISSNDSTKMTYYARILSAMKLSPSFRALITEEQRREIKRQFEVLKDREFQRRQKGETRPTDIAWQDLLACEKNFPPRSEAMLIHRLYTMLPAMRSDYTPVRIVLSMDDTTDTSENYIVLGERPVFMLNVYKTQGKYGQQVFPLPPEIVSLVPTNRDYLFEGSPGRPAKPNTLSKKVQRAYETFCGIHLNINAIRRSFAAHTMTLSEEDMYDQAIGSGHSLTTHRMYAARG